MGRLRLDVVDKEIKTLEDFLNFDQITRRSCIQLTRDNSNGLILTRAFYIGLVTKEYVGTSSQEKSEVGEPPFPKLLIHRMWCKIPRINDRKETEIMVTLDLLGIPWRIGMWTKDYLMKAGPYLLKNHRKVWALM